MNGEHVPSCRGGSQTRPRRDSGGTTVDRAPFRAFGAGAGLKPAPTSALCLALLATLVVPSRAAADEPKALVFSGVTVLDGVGGVRENATVSVRDGKLALAAGDGRRVEVKGAYLTPGLVDCASRAGYAKGETEHTRETTPDVDALDLADPWSDAFREAARSGCTTVSLVPGPSNVVSGVSRAFRTWSSGRTAKPVEGAKEALLLTLANEASNGNFPPRGGPTESIYARRPNTRMGVVWMLRQTFLDARAKPADPAYERCREALDGRRPVRLFAHRWQDMSAALRIADEVGLKDVAFVGGEEAYLGREELGRRKATVVVGPAPSETSGEWVDQTDSALSNAALLRAAGVRVALTAGNLGAARLREQAMNAVRWGLSKDDALAAVTSVAADVAGLAGGGRLVDGAAADVVLWSGHPLLPSSRALLVVAGGEVVWDETETKR
jgi:imidazolonepropionase-like amidohydrolase